MPSTPLEWLINIALWTLWVVLTAKLARSKGYDEFSAGRNGCLFGPFALLWYGLAAPRKAPPMAEPEEVATLPPDVTPNAESAPKIED